MKGKVILGIDPGLADTGYAVIQVIPRTANQMATITVLTYGVIKTKSGVPIMKRLSKIYNEVGVLIDSTRPTDVVIERFIGGSTVHNRSTTCTVNQSIGSVLCCIGNSYPDGIPLQFFSAREVKKNITGYGSASKIDMQNKVKDLLGLDKIPKPNHAADALGLTICYSRKRRWI